MPDKKNDKDILKRVNLPEDIRRLDLAELNRLAEQIRETMIETVSTQGGHLASSLGTVELTLAIHFVFARFVPSPPTVTLVPGLILAPWANHAGREKTALTPTAFVSP